MVIYPDRDPLAAATILGLIVGHGQGNDAIRAWTASTIRAAQAVSAGEVVVILHDGVGTRDAVEPNKDSWLFVLKCKDPYRGCAQFRFDGPSKAGLAAAIERAKLDVPEVLEGKPTSGDSNRL